MPPSDAEDLASEVFAIAWDTWDDVPAEPRPWIFGVARNIANNHLRTTGRRQQLELRVADERAVAQQGWHDGGHNLATTAMDLRLAWSRLAESDREVIALVAWDGLTGQEAAQVLGCTRAAFSVRLTRARRRLAHLLDEYDVATPAPCPTRTPAFSEGGLS